MYIKNKNFVLIYQNISSPTFSCSFWFRDRLTINIGTSVVYVNDLGRRYWWK